MNDLPTPVVIDIDDSVDVVLVPADIATRAGTLVPGTYLPDAMQTLALLIARLGSATARPAIHLWLDSPGFLQSFPQTLRDDLISGAIVEAPIPPETRAPHPELAARDVTRTHPPLSPITG
jgi:hypothetical protein